MTRFSPTTRNLQAALRSPLAAVLAGLLVLTASVDPQTCFGAFAAAPQKASDTQDDNDDEMLDTAARSRTGHQARRQPHAPKGALARDAATSFPPRPNAGPSRPAAPDCEHDFRNGLGAPLLC
jgi:hypothetical protein